MGPTESNKEAIGSATLSGGPTALEQKATRSVGTAEDAAKAFQSMTRTQIGKLRSQYFTVRYGTVAACGHKFHPTDSPDTNCGDCWEAYFHVHEGVVQGIDSILSTFGEAALVKSHGTKYTKRYKQFAAALKEQQNAVALLPSDVQSDPGFTSIP